MEKLFSQLKGQHEEELHRKNEEIEDLAKLNDEAIRTANESTFSEKKYRVKIKALKDEIAELKKEAAHKERCYSKM